jgi:PAS domain-containing protein
MEEHRLRILENRALRRIFEQKRDEMVGAWRELHNEELHDLYSLPSIIRMIKPRRMRWAGNVAGIGEKRNEYKFLVGKPEGRRPLGRQRRRWVNHIRMDLIEVGWGVADWIGLAQDKNRWRALVISVLNLRIP